MNTIRVRCSSCEVDGDVEEGKQKAWFLHHSHCAERIEAMAYRLLGPLSTLPSKGARLQVLAKLRRLLEVS